MSKQSTSENESERLRTRLRPNTLGEVFGTMAVVGGSSFLFSVFGLVAYAATLPDGVMIPQSNPLVVLGIVSWVCVTISLWSYVVWATLKLRNQPRDSNRSTRWNDEGDDLYERRQRRIFIAFGVGLFALVAPVAMLTGSPGR